MLYEFADHAPLQTLIGNGVLRLIVKSNWLIPTKENWVGTNLEQEKANGVVNIAKFAEFKTFADHEILELFPFLISTHDSPSPVFDATKHKTDAGPVFYKNETASKYLPQLTWYVR